MRLALALAGITLMIPALAWSQDYARPGFYVGAGGPTPSTGSPETSTRTSPAVPPYARAARAVSTCAQATG